MRRKTKPGLVRKIIAVIFMFLGVLGGFLPFMPGFAFFFMGLSMISDDFSMSVKTAMRRYRCHRRVFKFLKEIFVSAYDIFIKEKFKPKNDGFKKYLENRNNKDSFR